MKNEILSKAIRKISYYLSVKEQQYALLMFILLLIASILDVFGLASLVPIIMAASTPTIIKENKYFYFLFDLFHFQNEKSFLIFLIIIIFFFFLIKNVFSTWINYKQVKFTASIALNVINRQFLKYINLPYWQFNNEGSSKLINNIYYIPQAFVSYIIRPVFIILSELTIITVIVIGIFFYQPLLFILLILVLVPSAIGTYNLLKKRSEKIGNKVNQLRPISFSILSNVFNGFIELKLGSRLNYFRSMFFKNQKETQSVEATSYLYSQLPIKVIEMVAVLGIVVIFLYSLMFTGSSKSIITIIGLFVAAAYRLMPSVNRLLASMITLKQNNYVLEELNAFSEYELESIEDKASEALSFRHNIQFKNITFTFPGSSLPALSNINLEIKKGEKVGFIGASGSGKTTLMNILLRFYKEQRGNILLDGVPIDGSNKSLWYKSIGYVKQDTFLMEASIKDNITLMEEEYDREKLDYALEMASLKEFISTLPNGVDTFIGERGSRLSGGQKQRIGIARALYKNSSVLILDEATSALDTNTEREVSEAISKLAKSDITILIIAHRITTLRECNKIYEMKSGHIINMRSYEEVLNELI